MQQTITKSVKRPDRKVLCLTETDDKINTIRRYRMDYTYFYYYITVAFSSAPLSHRSVNKRIRHISISYTLACMTYTPAHKTRAKPGPWDHTVYLPRLIRIFRVFRLLSRRAWRVLCTALTNRWVCHIHNTAVVRVI